MDLKIKDVAELLHVSETTIRRWIAEGKIPNYRLNQQYRFSRNEIENWVLSCKQKHNDVVFLSAEESKEPAAPAGGSQQFSLYRAVHKGGVFSDIPGESKEELIRAAMKRHAVALSMDPEVLTDLLLDREALMPTALNRGIAVPHTRDLVMKGPFDAIFVVFPEKPIPYGALDGQPVHTLFFLFSGTDKHHLHLLAKLAHLSSSDPAQEVLRCKPSRESLLEYIREWETHLRHPTESESLATALS